MVSLKAQHILNAEYDCTIQEKLAKVKKETQPLVLLNNKQIFSPLHNQEFPRIKNELNKRTLCDYNMQVDCLLKIELNQ